MKATDLKNLIGSLTQDVTFEYNGKYVCINPWSAEKFEVGYGDKIKTYNNLDELMDDKFFDGNSLNDICTIIEID